MSQGLEVVDAQMFTSHQGGELAGWAHAFRPSQDIVIASVAVAQIAEGGAHVRSWYRDDPKDYCTSSNSIVGFEQAYNISVTADGSDGFRTRDSNGSRYDMSALYGKPELSSGLPAEARRSFYGHAADGSQWALGAAIPAAIRSVLVAEGAEAMYGPVYYRLGVTADLDTQVTDVTMREATQEQLQRVSLIHEKLSEQHKDNVRLTGLIADSPSRELPGLAESDFVRQRRKAHEIEKSVFQTVAQTAFSGMHLYAPTGHGKGGRTWPFMDAGATDERKAFGLEQDSLSVGNAGRVVSALEAEARELESRIEFAYEIVQKLRHLGARESMLAEAAGGTV